MKLTWIDYTIIVWSLLFVITSVIEIASGRYNPWILPAYLIVWGVLMMIKSLIEEK
ncbi:MAG: hypothetical protein WCP89_04250 [archaeon]